MISAVMPDQPVAATNAIHYRHRPSGERSVLHDNTYPAAASPKPDSDTPFFSGEQKPPAQPEAPAQPSASTFAAAVLSGALPPVPLTMDELVRRIGLSPIPEESQARLKDLLA